MPRTRRGWLAGWIVWLGLAWGPCGVWGQENPVFLDDSTLASDVLAGLPGLLASSNEGEAVRLLQRLLDEEGDRLVATTGDDGLFESVRSRTNRILLSDPALLERYRASESARAETLLEEGRASEVERALLLTPAGFEAAVRVAGEHLDAGRFASARLTLTQLERHPDRSDVRLAARAAAVWRALSRYLDRADVRESAARWAAAAGVETGPPTPAPWPESLSRAVQTPESDGAAVDAETLVGTPLCSAPLQPIAVLDADPEAPVTRRARTVQEYPNLFPVAVGDTVYTTDGLWISAWDRFTLTPRWQVKPRGADNEREALEEQYAARTYRRNRSRDVEESATLAVHGRILVVATGLVADGGRVGDPRLHALDTETGRVLWSSYVDELDDQLEESSTRGPAVFEGDLAVVAVRKISQTKRFASAYLVGIDLADGSARWVRLAGSAGWLGYAGRGQWSDWPTLHEGVVYRVDELGVICAVEAGSGRYRWVRKLTGMESRLPSPRLPWASSRPVIDGDTMLALSPDRSELLRIDLETGAILGRRDARLLGQPGYIFAHGDRLFAVSPTRIASVPLDAAESAPIVLSDVAPEPGILGRVVSAGESLLAPVTTGVVVLNAANLREGRGVVLDAPGNLLPLDNQLLAVDNEQLHSYLGWEKASEVLRARLDADPSDVGSAISYAELAYRAGHPEAALEPVDRALAAMSLDPLGPDVQGGQHRLFGLLLEMLSAAGAKGMLTPELANGAVERLGAVAMTTDERATHLLMLTQVRERGGRPSEALDACQKVLADPRLASASWRRAGSSVRAEVEALARLDELLRVHGLGLYEPFDLEATAELSRLEEADAAPEGFEALARRYPRAQCAAEAWLDAAVGHAARNAPLATDRALSRGIDAALAARTLGRTPDPAIVGELVGRRVSALLEANRLDAAAGELALADERWPGLALTTGRSVVDRSLLESILRDRVAARDARPVISPDLSDEAVSMEGWALMRPLDRRDAFTRRETVLLQSGERVGAWGFDQQSRRMVERWGLATTTKPSLVRQDAERVLLYQPDEGGGTLLSLGAGDGAELWRSVRLGEALARAEGRAAAAGGGERLSPLDGRVSASDLVLAVDETVIAVVSRSGRAVGIDASTGRELWSTRSACQSVHDAAAGEGVLVLGGTATPDVDDQASEPVVTVLDLASGEELSRFTANGARVRWVQVARGSGRAIVGLSRGLVCLSLPDAQVQWTLTESGLEDSSAGWIFGDRLFLQTSMLELALVDTAIGSLMAPRLEAAGCLDVGPPIDAIRNGDLVTFLSPAGCVMLDARNGERVGADAIEPAAAGLVQPVPARDALVLCEREPLAGQAGVYRLHVLDNRSGRALATRPLMLEQPPRRIALLDGVILITTDDQTVVLPTGSAADGR